MSIHRFTFGSGPPDPGNETPQYAESLLIVPEHVALISEVIEDVPGWYGRVVMSSGYVIFGAWATRAEWLQLAIAVQKAHS